MTNTKVVDHMGFNLTLDLFTASFIFSYNCVRLAELASSIFQDLFTIITCWLDAIESLLVGNCVGWAQ